LRKLLALFASAALIFSLSACSSINSVEAMYGSLKAACGDVTSQKSTGRAVDSVKVAESAEGASVDFATPLTSKAVETAMIKEGKGPKVTGNQAVELEYLGVNAGTGEIFQPSSFDGSGSSLQVLVPGREPVFCEALGGVREGSRVAILFPAAIIHKGQGIEELKIGKSDDVLFIMEVRKVFLPFAVGNEQAAQSGFPTVIRAVNGVPGVEVPSEAPFPKASKDGQESVALEVLIQGAGKTIAEGDKVILHYAGYTWFDGAKFDSSWDKGQPANFTLTKGGLIPGFIQALVGQKVGSQVVAVIPPALGYGAEAQGTIPSNSTLVFVIDILGVQD
jgi:peptidylprolyl isomerase